MMNFDARTMYYIGCILLCVSIVLICAFLFYIRKILKSQEEILEGIRSFQYTLGVINDHLRDIDSDIYYIRQRTMGER